MEFCEMKNSNANTRLLHAMVKRHCKPDRQTLKIKNIMTLPTDTKLEKATQKPTLKVLIWALPTFFCFSPNEQLALLALADTQTNLFHSNKSQFLTDPRLRTMKF